MANKGSCSLPPTLHVSTGEHLKGRLPKSSLKTRRRWLQSQTPLPLPPSRHWCFLPFDKPASVCMGHKRTHICTPAHTGTSEGVYRVVRGGWSFESHCAWMIQHWLYPPCVYLYPRLNVLHDTSQCSLPMTVSPLSAPNTPQLLIESAHKRWMSLGRRGLRSRKPSIVVSLPFTFSLLDQISLVSWSQQHLIQFGLFSDRCLLMLTLQIWRKKKQFVSISQDDTNSPEKAQQDYGIKRLALDMTFEIKSVGKWIKTTFK